MAEATTRHLFRIRIAVSLCCFFLLALAGCGGGTVGTDGGGSTKIVGRIVEADSDAPVGGAKVTLKNKNKSTTTDSSGNFELDDLVSDPSLTIEITTTEIASEVTLTELPAQPLEIEIEVAVRAQKPLADLKKKVIKPRPTPTATPTAVATEVILPTPIPTVPTSEEPIAEETPSPEPIYDPTTDPRNTEEARIATDINSTQVYPVLISLSQEILATRPVLFFTRSGTSLRTPIGSNALLGGSWRFSAFLNARGAPFRTTIAVRTRAPFRLYPSTFRILSYGSLTNDSLGPVVGVELKAGQIGGSKPRSSYSMYGVPLTAGIQVDPTRVSSGPTVSMPVINPQQILVDVEVPAELFSHYMSSSVSGMYSPRVVAQYGAVGLHRLRALAFNRESALQLTMQIYSPDYTTYQLADKILTISGSPSVAQLRARLESDGQGGYRIIQR